MALVHGIPIIPTDKISMLLDVENPSSYPGSGSTWTCLVDGRNFQATGGTQTPLTTQDGNKCFQFNGSGFWESSENTDGVDMGSDCTLLMWIYQEDNTERDTIFEKVGPLYQSYQHEIAVTCEVGFSNVQNYTWYSRYSPNYDTASTASDFSNNEWHLLGIKMSTGRTSAARTGFYSRNGAAWAANYNSRSDTALVSAGNIRVGSGYAGEMENGKIAMVATYNKMLSDLEVEGFYNATRKRLGL